MLNIRLPIVNGVIHDVRKRNVSESFLCAARHKTHHILWRTDQQQGHISDSSMIRSGFGREINAGAKT